MKQPYFSIVIPTKNRPGMLYDAIASALGQDFDDYEVIVSNNMNDGRTQETIDKFQGNPKLKSIRTPTEMNMLTHWEWATKQATGVYVIVLPDRKVLFKNALRNLYKYVHDSLQEKMNCISYAIKMYDETKHEMGWSFHEMPSRIFSSIQLIENFLNVPYGSGLSLDHFFPKTLNSCYKSTYSEAIRKEHGTYFSTPGCTTPDYSSFFINCSQNKEVAYCGKPTILSQGETTSNGRQFGLGKFTAYLSMLGLTDEELYSQVPLRLPLIYNWLVIDFITIRKKFGGNIETISVDWDNYFFSNYVEVNYKKLKREVSDELISDMMSSYQASIELHSPALFKQISEKYERGEYKNELNPVYHITPVKKSMMHIRDFVLARRTNPLLKEIIGDGKYSSVLEAAGFDKNKK